MDLFKFFLFMFRMYGCIWRIEYEGLKLICFKCRKIVYMEDECDLFNIVNSGSFEIDIMVFFCGGESGF